MEEKKQGFCLEDKHARWMGLIIVEMLVNTSISNNGGISSFPIIANPVMNLMSSTFQDVEDRAVHVAMFLAAGARGEYIYMALDSLRDSGLLRVNGMLDKQVWAPLERYRLAFINPWLLQEVLQKFCIFAR